LPQYIANTYLSDNVERLRANIEELDETLSTIDFVGNL